MACKIDRNAFSLPASTHRAAPPPGSDGSNDEAPAAAGSGASSERIVPLERWPSAVAALGAFLRARHAAVGIGSVLTITVMIFLCGGLMAIAHEAYSQDRMDRAARAAARAIALLPPGTATDKTKLNAVVCDVLRIEFDLDQQNDCSNVGPIDVATNLTTVELSGAGQQGNGRQPGDMILVQIGSGHAVIRREPTK